jgi:hypothetical protein
VVSSIAIVCWRACKSHPIIRISASFGPSTVRVNAETVYSGRREADVVMPSTGQVKYWARAQKHVFVGSLNRQFVVRQINGLQIGWK